MANNSLLGQAKQNKKDEFYTQLSDIESELQHYKEHFKNKVVFCNCDDPYESNFFKYFILNFDYLGLKRLITTCYSTSPVAGTQMSLFDEPSPNSSSHPYKVIIDKVEDLTGDGAIDLEDIRLLLKTPGIVQTLDGDGDFRSEECINLLREADIVVTNPPFSLFREYMSQLITYNKKFLIIGNVNAITYKEIFPLIKDNKLWLGPSITSGDRKFTVPDNYELSASGCGIDETGKKFIRVKGVRWFTNLDHNRRHEPLELYKRYLKHENEYLKYDNYDAIEIGKTAEIPYDFDGIMGVPITFLDKYCPEQFEILGMCENEDLYLLKTKVYSSQQKKDAYFAKFGKTGQYDLNASGVLFIDGKYEKVYQRILIRRKE